MKFRKKPVVIEAVKWSGDNPTEIDLFCGENVSWPFGEPMICTSEGDMTAREGDWIIRGIKGEFYPCKPDIFEATYEPAEHVKQATPPLEQLSEILDECVKSGKLKFVFKPPVAPRALVDEEAEKGQPNWRDSEFGSRIRWLVAKYSGDSERSEMLTREILAVERTEAARAREGGVWIPCAEKLPRDGTIVFVWDTSWNASYLAQRDEDSEFGWDPGDHEPPNKSADITHWMAFPKYPGGAPAKEPKT